MIKLFFGGQKEFVYFQGRNARQKKENWQKSSSWQNKLHESIWWSIPYYHEIQLERILITSI